MVAGVVVLATVITVGAEVAEQPDALKAVTVYEPAVFMVMSGVVCPPGDHT
jgi:hypothetical protein